MAMDSSTLSRMLSFPAYAPLGGATGDMLGAAVANRGLAMGAPMLTAGLGMMGFDPISWGLKAGMGAWGAGAGIGMTALSAVGGAAIPLAGMGAISYAGGQMVSGAQQQLMLNQGLRTNFNFMNSQGGMGFTSRQGYDIGATMRAMTHDFGPSGEIASFGELSRLANNMGRMNMAQGVKSASEFKDKFKEMVDTLKKVAHDMGTSLEDAQKFVNAMKGSGIYQKSDQLRFSGQTRLFAAAGGMATSEVSGMANIGAQISRAVGGLGSYGAFGGMKTIGQIGAAGQIGALTEQDIYNSTGMTGAEGRQAMATDMMQRSASFLQTARGRYFLASVAGRNGQLDASSVSQWMAGGMSVADTQRQAHENLSGIGRANFIRNEGRLRGAALGQFGGMLQTMAYKNWLQEKGYDPSAMDDMGMLAFQRFSGMGRDEADNAIRMVNSMPEISMQMKNTQDDLQYSDAVSQRKKTRGVEGLKRRVAQIREGIESKLQQIGSDIMERVSDSVEGMVNESLGTYERLVSDDFLTQRHKLAMGGSAGQQAFEELFGTSPLKGAVDTKATGLYQTRTAQLSAMSSITADSSKLTGFDKSELRKYFMGSLGSSDVQKIASGLSAKFGAKEVDPALAKVLKNFKIDQGKEIDPEILRVLKSGDSVERARVIQQLQLSSGVPEAQSLRAAVEKEIGNPLLSGAESTGSPTERQAMLRMGDKLLNLNRWTTADDAMTPEERKRAAEERRKLNETIGMASVSAGGGHGSGDGSWGRGVMQWLSDSVGKSDSSMSIGAAQALMKYKGTLGRIAAGKGTEADTETLDKQIMKLRGNEHLSDTESGELGFLVNARVASEHTDILARLATDEKSVRPEERALVAATFKSVSGRDMTKDDLEAMKNTNRNVRGAANEIFKNNLDTHMKMLVTETARTRDSVGRMSGVSEVGGKLVLSDASRKGMDANELAVVERYLKLANFDQTDTSVLSKETLDRLNSYQDPEMKQAETQRAMAAYQAQLAGGAGEDFSKMTLAGKKAYAKKHAGDESGTRAGYAAAIEERFAGLEKRYGGAIRDEWGDVVGYKGGARSTVGAVGNLLGLDLDDKALDDMSGGSDKDRVNKLMELAGISDKGSVRDTLLEAFGSKDQGKRAQLINTALQDESVQKKIQEAREQKQSATDPTFKIFTEMRDTLRAIQSNTEKSSGNTEGPKGSSKQTTDH